METTLLKSLVWLVIWSNSPIEPEVQQESWGILSTQELERRAGCVSSSFILGGNSIPANTHNFLWAVCLLGAGEGEWDNHLDGITYVWDVCVTSVLCTWVSWKVPDLQLQCSLWDSCCLASRQGSLISSSIFVRQSECHIWCFWGFFFIFLCYGNALCSLKTHWIWLITLNKFESSLPTQ